MADPWLVLAAAGVEGLIGYPHALHRRVPHPVTWLGALIGWTDARWNTPAASEPARRTLGIVATILTIGAAAAAGWFLQVLAARTALSVIVVVAGAFGLAARSLFDHIAAVDGPLSGGDLEGARAAIAKVAGRDVEALEAGGVANAALESLAESFNDGVVAPLFWFVLGGLPGLFAYKAVNTADSMIGHLEPRWRAFGWAAARTDDLMNLIPARIAGLLICLVAGAGWRVLFRDASKHASPNAGWPEAAMAGALGVRLGGPARYDGVLHERPSLGDGPLATPADIRRGLGLYLRACAVLGLALAIGGLAWPR